MTPVSSGHAGVARRGDDGGKDGAAVPFGIEAGNA